MTYAPVHPSIAHLNADALDALVAAYVSGTSASAIIQRFKINIAPSRLRSIMPLRFANQVCEACGKGMVQGLPQRGASADVQGVIRCPACRHELTTACRCPHCRRQIARRLEAERAIRLAKIKEAIVAERDRYPTWGGTVDDMPLLVAVSYLALCRCCQPDELQLCMPLESSDIPFAPTTLLQDEMVQHLRKLGLISISDHSSPDASQLDARGFVFNPDKVRWQLRAESGLTLTSAIESAGRTGSWPARWGEEAAGVWMLVAMAECRQYFDHCARQRGFHCESDHAISVMLTNLLQDMSVAQCYRAIWFGARAAADFLVRSRCSRPHAANYMIGACQRWADHARADCWNVVPFKRNFDLPRSMISYVLFDVILKIGECGFTEPVGKILRASA